MTLSRTTAGLLVVVATTMLLAVGACSTTAGVAVRRPSPTAPRTTAPITTTAPRTTAPITTNAPITTTAPAGTTAPVGPPTCGDTMNRLTTPTGAPIITVTAGANFFIANAAVEPLSLAIYADGTALSSLGVGTSTAPLPRMTIGYVPDCTVEWAKREIEQLATVDLGQPNVTDQGTTEVSYIPAGGAPVRLSAAALGIDDKYLMTGKEGRARLTRLLAALRAPLERNPTWTPDRLRVVEVPAPVQSAGPALVWPGTRPLAQVLGGRRFQHRCGVVSGPDAAAVLQVLGNRFVSSRWTDAGKATGLNIGALVPGQSGCDEG